MMDNWPSLEFLLLLVVGAGELTPELQKFARDCKTFNAIVRDISAAAETEKVKTQQQVEQKNAEVAACSGQLNQKQHELNVKKAELSGQEVQLNEAHSHLAHAQADALHAQHEYDEALRRVEPIRNCITGRKKRGIEKLFKKLLEFPCHVVYNIDSAKDRRTAAARKKVQAQARVHDLTHLVNQKRAKRDHAQHQVSAVTGQKCALEHQLSVLQVQLRRETELVAPISLFYGYISTVFDHSGSLQNVMDKLISTELLIAPLEQISEKLMAFTGDQLIRNDISAALTRMRQYTATLKEKLPQYPLFFLNHAMV
ncbi:cytospin-A-like isoform X2 [Paramacrobiotus metropolitanus]|uniref:cytospin-A-like isoform X2 n=1 Tax=Paramacrobiotus metropolitanus TaxID=2943436 RepID=UPI00244622E7|nr:cytospin-A-like isoform X2 [Paramacrobiotus metropolitanus]XP_055351505.1 cytospin-A-like isoform X2 [Paramacrobiotus metropolitanus]